MKKLKNSHSPSEIRSLLVAPSLGIKNWNLKFIRVSLKFFYLSLKAVLIHLKK